MCQVEEMRLRTVSNPCMCNISSTSNDPLTLLLVTCLCFSLPMSHFPRLLCHFLVPVPFLSTCLVPPFLFPLSYLHCDVTRPNKHVFFKEACTLCRARTEPPFIQSCFLRYTSFYARAQISSHVSQPASALPANKSFIYVR